MMARIAVPRPASMDPGALLRPLLPLLAAAALLEWLLLRTFTRTAIHVPDIPAMEAPYSMAADLGRYAYFVAATSLLASLVLLTLTLSGRRDPRCQAAALGAGAFLVAATMLRLGGDSTVLTLALSLAAVVVTAAAATARSPRTGAFIVPVSVAFGLAIAYAISQSLALGAGSAAARWLHTSMEVPALLAGLAAPFAFGVSLRGRNLAVAIGAAILVFVLFAGSPSTSRILLLWNQGLSGALPGSAYAIAAGLAGGALAGVVRAGRWNAAIALVLIAAAGLGVENTYQTGLLVCALLLLALPAAGASAALQPAERAGS